MKHNGSGAVLDLRAQGSILATDYALDAANPTNGQTLIQILAGQSVAFEGMGIVVDNRDLAAGKQTAGGLNRIRAFNGGITVASGAEILAVATDKKGDDGRNETTVCGPSRSRACSIRPRSRKANAAALPLPSMRPRRRTLPRSPRKPSPRVNSLPIKSSSMIPWTDP